MNRVRWLLEHSEASEVPCGFAWSYMTDVRNWDDPPARFELDGPFEAGSCGRTLLPDREAVEWRIRQVQPGSSYLVESDLGGALLLCEWTFVELSEGATRLSQRVGLLGHDAARHADGVRAAFESTLGEGMRRTARRLEAARDRRRR